MGTNPGSYNFFPAEAIAAGLTLVNLPTVPNQPLTFAGEGFSRTEDEIIAKTFSTYLDGGDDQWPLLLPMVKSAVRAMDATQMFMATKGVTIDNFYVFDGSKRGRRIWLTAAVEANTTDRIKAIVPGVIDVLNMDESLAHHRRVYDGVTEKIIGGYGPIVR